MKFLLVHGLDELQRVMDSGPAQKFQCVIYHCKIDARKGYNFFGNSPEQRPLVITQTDSVLIGCRLEPGEAVPAGVAEAISLRL